ncbi:hypothetical protein EBZ80_00365 [bacterium]|nr:hypothetical protein [bacterium]
MPSSSSKKIWIIGPVAAIALALLAAIALPFLIDLEKFKPQIQTLVSGAVNAEIDFKSIRLHAIPKLGVTIKDAEIRNTDPTFKGTTLFKTDELFLATEFWSLLQGKMEGELRVVNPAIEVAMNNATNNLAALAKAPSGGIAPAPTPTPSAGPAAAPSAETVSAIRDRVLIKAVTILGASAAVKSGGRQLAKVSDLDFTIRNIGLDRDIEIALDTDLKAREAGAVAGGSISARMTTRIESAADALFKQINFDGKLDLTGLALNFRDALVKKPGQVIAMRIKGAASTTNLRVDEMGFDILNIRGTGNLAVNDFKSLKTLFAMNISSPDVSSLGALLPQHEKMLQKASLKVDTKVDGPLADLSAVQAGVSVESKLAGSDFALNVGATSILPAKASIKVTSEKIDLGALVKPFMPQVMPKDAAAPATSGPAATSAPATSGPAGTPGTVAPEKDLALSDELKQTLKPHVIDVDVSLREIVWDRLAIKGLVVKAGFKDLQLALERFAMQALGGTISADGNLNLAGTPVEFRGSFKMDGVSATDAIEVIAPAQKEALAGKLSVALAADAKGTTRQTLVRTLNAKGSYAISDVRFNGGSLRPLVAESFAGFVSGLTSGKVADKAFKNIEKFLESPLGKKLPADKKPDVNTLKKKVEGIKVVRIPDKYAGEKKVGSSSGQIEIKEGKLRITSDSSSDLGRFKLDAITTVEGDLDGLIDVTLSESETQGLLKQSEYAALLLDKNKSLMLPFKLGGNVLKPKLAIQSGPLTRNFEDNATARLEQEAKKAIDDAAKQATREAMSKAGIDQAKIDELKKQTAESRKKLEEQAKDKLKGLFNKQ